MGCTADDDDGDYDVNDNNTLKYYRYETSCMGSFMITVKMRYNDRHKEHKPLYVSV
jgi:hypothetical protein